jgi:hypothetical protein
VLLIAKAGALAKAASEAARRPPRMPLDMNRSPRRMRCRRGAGGDRSALRF